MMCEPVKYSDDLNSWVGKAKNNQIVDVVILVNFVYHMMCIAANIIVLKIYAFNTLLLKIQDLVGLYSGPCFKIVEPPVILVKPPCGVECVSRRKDTEASGSNFVQQGDFVVFCPKGPIFVLS